MFLKTECISSLITLSNLSFFIKHLRFFFNLIFLRISLSFLFLFFVCNIFIHFSSHLFCIRTSFIWFLSIFFSSYSLFFFIELLSFGHGDLVLHHFMFEIIDHHICLLLFVHWILDRRLLVPFLFVFPARFL